nr:unnamed protein product [Naegleria fowleri]
MIDTILKRKRDNDGKMKYFVKLRGQSHWHCEWLSREEVQQNTTLKLMWFEDHYGRDLEIDLFNPNCEKIEQIIASNGNNFFVKWKDVPYSGCTWETKKDISKHGYNADLFYTFITTHRKKAYKILSEEELSKKRMESQNSAHDISKISVTNVGGHSFELFDYQLQGVAWMKSMWIQHKNCMLCDQPGLGKTTQVVSFLRAMTIYNIVPGPFLITSPRNRIEHWKEQINFWAPDLRVAVYDGLHEDRIIIKQFIIQTIQKRDLTPTDRMNFSVNIILTTSESMVDDEKCSETCGSFISLLNSNNSTQNFPQELLLRRERQQILECIKPKADLLLTVSLTPLHKYFFRQIFKKSTYFNALLNVFKNNDTSQYSSLFQQMFSDILRTCEHPYLQFFLDKEEPFSQNNELFMKYFIQSSSKLVLLDMILQKCNSQQVLILSSYPYVIEEMVRFKGYHYQVIVSNEKTNHATTNIAPIVIMSTQVYPSIELFNFDKIIVMDSAYHSIIDAQHLARFCKIDKNTIILRLVCCEEFETMILDLSENERTRGIFLKQLSELETSLRIFANDLFKNNETDSSLIAREPSEDELTSTQEGLEILQSIEWMQLSEDTVWNEISLATRLESDQTSNASNIHLSSQNESSFKKSNVKISVFKRKENSVTTSSLKDRPQRAAEIVDMCSEIFWTSLINNGQSEDTTKSAVKMENDVSIDIKRKDTTAIELSLHHDDEMMDLFFDQFLNSPVVETIEEERLYSDEEIQQYSETVAIELSDNLNALVSQVESMSATLKTVKDVAQRKKTVSNIRSLKFQIEDETIQLKIIEKQLINSKIKIYPNNSVSVVGFSPMERMIFVATLWRYGLGFPNSNNSKDEKWYEFYNILRKVSKLRKTLKQVIEFGTFMLDHFPEQVDQRYSHYSDGTPTDRLNNVKILQQIASMFIIYNVVNKYKNMLIENKDDWSEVEAILERDQNSRHDDHPTNKFNKFSSGMEKSS